MTISSEHPFLLPEGHRSALRRLRGRLALPVTLWTAGDAPGLDPTATTVRPAGLTVASMAVTDGNPAHILGLIDPESDLWTAIDASGHAVVTVLTGADRHLADVFGFVAPAPGGPFALTAWLTSEWGPVHAAPRAWAGVRLAEAREVGYSVLVDTEVEHIDFGATPESPSTTEKSDDSIGALALHRGHYLTVPPR